MTKTIRESVLDEITRLFEERGKVPVCRQDVVQATGIRAEALREHIDALIDDGMIYRVERGLYAPVDHQPTRPISITDLPDGRVKIEVGDELICLSASEHRILSARFAGATAHRVAGSDLAAHIIRQMREMA